MILSESKHREKDLTNKQREMARIIKKYSKTALVFGLIFVLVAMYFTTPKGEAAAMDKEKDTLSDSRPTLDANHEIMAVLPNAITEGETIVVKPDDSGNAFDLTGIIEDDIDLAEDTDASPDSCSGTWTDEETAAAQGAAEWGVDIDIGTDEITFTAPSGAGTYIAAGACIKIEIGKNATYNGTGDNQINNPAIGVYDITLTSDTADTGKAMVAIIAGVEVSATVTESLSFIIDDVSEISCPNTIGGIDRSDQAGHDDDSVPFGNINAGTFYFSCQSLAIATNASDGYNCTVQETDQLKFGAVEFPDGDCDSNCSETSNGTWTNTANDGFGYCMDDIVGNGAETAGLAVDELCDDATPEFMIFPEKGIDIPDFQTIMSSAGPVSDTSYVGYRINASATQTAGDYSNFTIYVVTPTY